ncbi:hypothetical protein F4604DRAFT_670685 [Suillus subluteus]|nr:hypothetical protein F4604DRAFT_670685 [Suillus subluteus]
MVRNRRSSRQLPSYLTAVSNDVVKVFSLQLGSLDIIMIELGRLYASIGTWLPRWKPLILSSSGISYRPLLATVDYSSQYEISGRISDDNPALALDYIDISTVEKRLVRKLDLRVAFLVLVFIINNMDRTNAAAARLRGYEEDLRHDGEPI